MALGEVGLESGKLGHGVTHWSETSLLCVYIAHWERALVLPDQNEQAISDIEAGLGILREVLEPTDRRLAEALVLLCIYMYHCCSIVIDSQVVSSLLSSGFLILALPAHFLSSMSSLLRYAWTQHIVCVCVCLCKCVYAFMWCVCVCVYDRPIQQYKSAKEVIEKRMGEWNIKEGHKI